MLSLLPGNGSEIRFERIWWCTVFGREMAQVWKQQSGGRRLSTMIDHYYSLYLFCYARRLPTDPRPSATNGSHWRKTCQENLNARLRCLWTIAIPSRFDLG